MLSQTKYILKNSATHVRVIRPHHPLLGQEFEILKNGKTYVEVLLADGSGSKIPRHWTDIDGPDACRVLNGKAIFTTQSLRELKELLEAFRKRSKLHEGESR
ncbi:MAG: hypothetical protein JXA57_15575 [Armatimonadetes bacterium]|nr:hypothetical protein [Armatimonadota bacterium]